MAQPVFFFSVELCCGNASIGQQEMGIVAKTSTPSRLVDYFSVPAAGGDDGRGIAYVAQKNDRAVVMGGAIGFVSECGDEFAIVRLVVSIAACVSVVAHLPAML